MFGNKNKRFKIIKGEGSVQTTQIIQDTKTGVNYLFHSTGYAGGLTPLLDEYGKVVVTPVIEDEK